MFPPISALSLPVLICLCRTGRLRFLKAVHIFLGLTALEALVRIAAQPDASSFVFGSPLKFVLPVFFILLNLVSMLYLPRKWPVRMQILLQLAVGVLFYLWMSFRTALSVLFGHSPLMQPFGTFHETIGLSLLITAFFNLFSILFPFATLYPLAAFHRRFNRENLEHPLLKRFLGNIPFIESAVRLFYAFGICIIFYGLWHEAFK